ncbi:hypothetical protein Rsub_10796 [Raphidocelis subcapitata]|uniref:Uncharacterized protein n=1 Tax=Raphidocelis subcapitata TaxID=307507 RepID=A0A2V0PML1_9CHLO|nr:hypothetical protein Rsub_10796 [Raphidocelis subcapitata]|eukprot:GBF98607.1 hypothetical protein Rsub_10796 [Raphidocelis subcapitata]
MSGKVTPSSGDPRRPDDARRFPRTAAGLDESGLDNYFLFSMMVALAGFALKNKMIAWCAVFVCAAGFANLSRGSALQHVTSSIAFSVMGLVASYIHEGPTGLAALFPAPKAAAAGA